MVGGLNGSAHRDLTRLQQIIKTSHYAFAPGVCQICLDPSAQRPEPVTLAAAVDTVDPFACLGLG